MWNGGQNLELVFFSLIIPSLCSYSCDLHDKVALLVLLLCYIVFCIEHVLTCKDVTDHCTQPMSMCRGENFSSSISSICISVPLMRPVYSLRSILTMAWLHICDSKCLFETCGGRIYANHRFQSSMISRIMLIIFE